MARILIDIKDKTKEKIMTIVRRKNTTIKDVVLTAIGVKDE